MNLQREHYTLNKYNTLIRTVSIFLIVVFMWQNVVWANPDIGSPSIALDKNNIQVQTIFSDPSNQHRSIADLIQETVERSASINGELSISDIKQTLRILDVWDEKHLGKFEWTAVQDEAGIDTEVIITIKNSSGDTKVLLRYYNQHPDPDFNRQLPYVWPDTEAHIINQYLYKQVKEFDEIGVSQDDLDALKDVFSGWNEEQSTIVGEILEFNGMSFTDKLGEEFVIKIEPNKSVRYPIRVNILRSDDRVSVGSFQLNVTKSLHSDLTLDLGLLQMAEDVSGISYHSRGIATKVLSLITSVMPNGSQAKIDELQEVNTLKELASGTSWVKTKMGKMLYKSGWKPEVISIYDKDATTYVLYDRQGAWKEFKNKNGFEYMLSEAITDIDETDRIDTAIVRIELSRIKRNRKTDTKTDSKDVQELASKEEGLSVYAEQSINKDRYEVVLGHMMNLFVLMARRMRAKEQKNELFMEPLRAVSRREAIATGFDKVAELIDKNNEPAASAFLVGKLNSIANEKDARIRKKIALRRTSVKVQRHDSKILMKHHVYIKQQEASKSAVPEDSQIEFNLRWQAGRSLDEQEDGILDEREWLLQGIESLEIANEKGPEYLAKAASEILAKMSRVDVEEKRLARIALDAVKKSIDSGYTEYVKHILPIAIRYLKLRVENLESMLGYLRTGRIEPFRMIVNEDNDELLGRTSKIQQYIKEKGYERALGNTYGLWQKIKPHLDEPDIAGLSSIVWPIISVLRKIKALDSKDGENKATIEASITKAEFWLGLARRKLSISKGLSSFMGEFRSEYVSRRLASSSSYTKKDTFIDVYDSFVASSHLVRGSPEEKGFKMLCYLAVFVPLEVKDPKKPSQRIANPVFEAINKLRLMVEIDNIKRILAIKKLENLKETMKFLKGHIARRNFSNFNEYEKTSLLKALTADFGLSDSERFEMAKTLAINKTNLHKKYEEIKGNAAEPQKLEAASLIALFSTPVFLIMVQFYLSSLIYAVSVFYIISMGAWPMLTAYFIRDGLSFRHERKDKGLIAPFENAENVRYIQDHEDEAKGKISYYSYAIEGKLAAGEEKEIKSALFVDKAALRRIPKLFQYVIYFHEIIHAKLRIKIEATAVPLTYTAPWVVSGLLAALVLSPILPRFELLFLLAFAAYNAVIPFISGKIAMLFGVTKSSGGHFLLDRKKHKHLKDNEIDQRIAYYAHAKTYDKTSDTSVYWRDWLRGGEGYKNFEIIECPNRPEDIIVIKSAFNVENPTLFLNIKVVLESSKKRSFVLIVADDGSENGLSKDSRRTRVELITRKVAKLVDSLKPSARLVKRDVRSTRYDITRLRDLLALYRRRLSRIRNQNVEREAVVSEVHGHTDKLRVLLKWLDNHGYRHTVFMGDYLGKKKNGIEAFEVFKEYIESKHNSGITLLMGRSEHIFLRAMLGDDRYTDTWPKHKVLEGSTVIKSLKALAAQKISHSMTVHAQNDIKKAKEFENLLEKIAKNKNMTKEEAWVKFYRLHPKLIEVAEFIVDKMRFVYHEDKHHNIYLIGSIPEDFEWNGLRGIEVLKAMEQEFCAGANIGLRQLKLMREVWLLMNVSEDENEAKREENVYKVVERLNAERQINRTLGIELISYEVLDKMESVITGEETDEHLDKIFDDISNRVSESTRPLPHIFDMVFPSGDDAIKHSPFMPGGKGGLNIPKASDETRQQARIALGVNTVITPDDFPYDGYQKLQWIRAFDREGNLRFIDVNALTEGKDKSEVVLAGQEKDGIEHSLEGVTKRKLEAVEKIVNDYDGLTVNVREKRLLETLKQIVRSPLFYATLATIALIYAIKFFGSSGELVTTSGMILLFTGMVSQQDYDEEDDDEEESYYFEDASEDPYDVIDGVSEEIEEIQKDLEQCKNIKQTVDVGVRLATAITRVQETLSQLGMAVSVEDTEIYEILIDYEQNLNELKGTVAETIEKMRFHPEKGVEALNEASKDAAKKLKSGERGDKFLKEVGDKLESLFHLGEHIKENHPDMYELNLKRLEETKKTLEEVLTSLKGPKEGSSSTVNALIIASITGLLAVVYAPIVSKYTHGFDLTIRDLLFVYIGFFAGVFTVSILKGYDHLKAHQQMVAEKSKPIKDVQRVLILDDRQEYINQIKETYSHALVIKEAKTVAAARQIIEDNQPFDLVISDLCLHENPVLSVLKKVQINGKKVSLRRAGQDFVLWLKKHEKAPEHLILHSTMFNGASFDALFSILTGYNPLKTRKIVEKAGITVQPKSWTLREHRHSRKTILMWMGVIGAIFLYDMSIIVEHLDSYISILVAPVFATIVTGLGIKAIMAGRRKEKPEKEKGENEAGKPQKDKIVVEKKEEVKKAPAPRAPKKDITAEAIPLLEDVTHGNTNDIQKLVDLGYYTTLFYRGEKPAAMNPVLKISELAESLDFTLKEISGFEEFASEFTGELFHAKRDEIEVFMFRKIVEKSIEGIEIVARTYDEDVDYAELCKRYGFSDVVIEFAGEKKTYNATGLAKETKSDITKGTRIIIKRFSKVPPVMLPTSSELVTTDDIARYIERLAYSKTSFVTIYRDNGAEEYQMPVEEFKQKAPGRVGIIPRRTDEGIKWFEFLGSGGLSYRSDNSIEVVTVDETGRIYSSKLKERYVLGRGYLGKEVKIIHDSNGDFKVFFNDNEVALRNAKENIFIVTTVKFSKKCMVNYLGKSFGLSTIFAGEEVKVVPYNSDSSGSWIDGFRIFYRDEEIALYDASEDRFIELITKLDAQGRFYYQGVKFTVGKSYAGDVISISPYRGENWEKGCSVMTNNGVSGDCDLKTGKFYPDSVIARSTDEKGRFGFRGIRISLESKFANQAITLRTIKESGQEKGFKIYWADEEVGYYNFADETLEFTTFGKTGLAGYISKPEIVSMDEVFEEDPSQEEILLYEQGVYFDQDVMKEIRKEAEVLEETISELEKELDPKEVLSVIYGRLQPDLEALREDCSEENNYGLFRLFHPKLEEIQESIDDLISSAAEKIYPELDSSDEVIKNIEKIVPFFTRALRSWAGRVEESEEVVLFLDMPAEQSEKVKEFIEEMVIKPLQRESGDNVKTSDILRKLRIITRGNDNEGIRKLKMRVLGDKPRWKAENVVVLTSKSKLTDFSEIKGAFVTALDFSLLEVPEGFNLDEYYYPYVEAAFFALLRAIGTFDIKDEKSLDDYKERMWQWYRQIPNIEKLTRAQFEELVFNSDNSPKEVVMLKLIIPDAVKFNPQGVYEMVKEFIIRA